MAWQSLKDKSFPKGCRNGHSSNAGRNSYFSPDVTSTGWWATMSFSSNETR